MVGLKKVSLCIMESKTKAGWEPAAHLPPEVMSPRNLALMLDGEAIEHEGMWYRGLRYRSEEEIACIAAAEAKRARKNAKRAGL